MLGILLLFIWTIIPLSSDIKDEIPVHAPLNSVVLTFDDGPHPTHTAEILNILKEKKVKATFFLIGLHINRNTQVILREVREGHTVGTHSYSHHNFSQLTLPQMAQEVFLPEIQLLLLTGKYPKYFRFPYGVDDIRIRKFFSGKIISWNVDGYDWKTKNPKELADMIISQAKTGSIILLHDIKGDTVKALPYIIDGIRAKHLEFTTLPSFVASIPGKNNKKIQIFSRFSTGALHDHRVSKKPQRKSTEEVLDPIIITEVVPW